MPDFLSLRVTLVGPVGRSPEFEVSLSMTSELPQCARDAAGPTPVMYDVATTAVDSAIENNSWVSRSWMESGELVLEGGHEAWHVGVIPRVRRRTLGRQGVENWPEGSSSVFERIDGVEGRHGRQRRRFCSSRRTRPGLRRACETSSSLP